MSRLLARSIPPPLIAGIAWGIGQRLQRREERTLRALPSSTVETFPSSAAIGGSLYDISLLLATGFAVFLLGRLLIQVRKSKQSKRWPFLFTTSAEE
jgi:hypothetical protein